MCVVIRTESSVSVLQHEVAKTSSVVTSMVEQTKELTSLPTDIAVVQKDLSNLVLQLPPGSDLFFAFSRLIKEIFGVVDVTYTQISVPC